MTCSYNRFSQASDLSAIGFTTPDSTIRLLGDQRTYQGRSFKMFQPLELFRQRFPIIGCNQPHPCPFLRVILLFSGFLNDLPGRPDIVLPKYATVVFVHGCFWHAHEGCRYSKIPSTRSEFWIEKFDANRERDARKERELLDAGWRVAVVWECATRGTGVERSLQRLEHWLLSSREHLEIPKLSARSSS